MDELYDILPPHEAAAILDAGVAAAFGDPITAERRRHAAGYGGLSESSAPERDRPYDWQQDGL